jgi:hypothetical protein
MGYIQQSNTKKIYAYLTQLGKEKIISGDTIDFQVKYFSLHDEDINYIIASKTSGTTYNIPKSGFIPDITGDSDICLSAISDATFLEKNKLVGIIVPPQPEPPEPTDITATIQGTCSTDGETFEINVTNTQGGTGQGYYWYVKTDVITFPSATAGLIETTILSTSTSEDFQVNVPKSFKATFKFSDDYKLREADSYNFTVYVGDSSGTEVELEKFTDINCSKRIFGFVQYNREGWSNDPNQITETFLENYNDGDIYAAFPKYSFAAFVIDNGNRRRDLNITQNDIDNNFFFLDNYAAERNPSFGVTCPWYPIPSSFQGGLTDGFYINFKGTGTNFQQPLGIYSNPVIIPGVIIKKSNPTNSQLNNYQEGGPNAWFDSAYYLLPAGLNNPTNSPQFTNIDFDPLHPTVKLFNDMTGLDSFTIRHLEVCVKLDYSTANPGPLPWQTRTINFTYRIYKIGLGVPEFMYNPSQIGVPIFANNDNNITFAIEAQGNPNICG